MQGIKKLPRQENSPYKPSNLWDAREHAIFLKYCPSKRDRCYHAMANDMSARPHEILNLRIKDIIFKVTEDGVQFAEVLITGGKTKSRTLPLIDSIPYLKDWIHDHPTGTNSIPKSYLWIENKLLHTAIPDHRKYTVELLLAPFLINIKHLPVGHTYLLIKNWTSKCNALRRLEPSTEYFDNKIKTAINNSLQNGIPPIKKENMQRRYPDWYNGFKDSLILD